jgi:hypothetical protein
MHQAGLLAQSPFLTFPLLQWSEEETDSAKRIDFYSYGDSAGMKFCNWQPDFPFNDTLKGFNQMLNEDRCIGKFF